MEGGKYWEEKEVSIKEAVKKAKKADYIVLCLGENTYTEKPGDTHDLTLSDLQIQLANELASTGKPIILVLNEGRPRIYSKIDDKVAATVLTYLPGNFGGDALADILFGDVNPSGKLPYTYPRMVHSLINYWHKYSEEQVKDEGMYNYESDYSPMYEFGHGLSYTTFKYSDLKLSKKEITADEKPYSFGNSDKHRCSRRKRSCFALPVRFVCVVGTGHETPERIRQNQPATRRIENS